MVKIMRHHLKMTSSKRAWAGAARPGAPRTLPARGQRAQRAQRGQRARRPTLVGPGAGDMMKIIMVNIMASSHEDFKKLIQGIEAR